MNAKRQKLIDQFARDAATSSNVDKKSDIFEGVRIFVNGFTSPPAADLRMMMMEHGGIFDTYYVRDVTTHVVVSSMANSKQKIFDKQRCVSADWITESIRAGKLLDWRLFQFKSGVVKGQKGAAEFFPLKHEVKGESPPMKEERNDEEEEMMVDVDENESESGEMEEESYEAKENLPCQGSKSPIILASRKDGNAKPNENYLATNANNPVSNFSTIGRPQDPNFIAEFFKNSRLHLISQLGAEWKEYVRKLQEDAETREYPGRAKLEAMSAASVSPASPPERVIMHIDMDCFFVSVGLRSRPDLRGKPVAVTHSRSSGVVRPRHGTDLAMEKRHYEMKRDKPLKSSVNSDDHSAETHSTAPFDLRVMKDPSLAEMSTSEIASCSYEARAAGVKNGSFLGAAKKLCPSLITIPYDFEGYRSVSKILYDVVASYTCRIEAVSCDECYVDLTELVAVTRLDPLAVASVIREDIRGRTECPASTGLGPNLLVARLATRLAKPDGQFRVAKSEIGDFIRQQPIGDLPGVGRAASSKFAKMGVSTCGDLQGRAQSALQKEFGAKQGAALFKLCRGEDDRPIDACKVRKSVSVDVNYGIRFEKDEEPFEFLAKLATEVESRMKNISVKGKMISLKVLVRSKDAPVEPAKFGGHGIVDHLHKSNALGQFSNDAAVITRETHQMLRSMETLDGGAISARDIRGMGITITKLDNQHQLTTTAASNGLRDISSFIRKRAAEDRECEPTAKRFQQQPQLHQQHPLTPLKTSLAAASGKENVRSSPTTTEETSPNRKFRNSVVDLISVAKVKPLIKEWLNSRSDPCEEDVDFACALLLTCVYKHELPCVFSLCNMFMRKMKDDSVSASWSAAMDAVIQVVQEAVEEEFGHPFLLN